VNAHTTKFKLKSGDKVTLNGTIVIAADGTTRTVTASGTSADGKKVSYTAMYDKQ
jgi:tartrate dehydratase beta subunit/fumarate hydratase class I family protein